MLNAAVFLTASREMLFYGEPCMSSHERTHSHTTMASRGASEEHG